MRWNKVWIVPFYLADFVVFVAALFCLIYFLKYRRSPLIRAYQTIVDNGILIILCLFCLVLPAIHFGEMSSIKCLSQWLLQNVMYAIYCGLLFTKIPYFRNTRAGRRIACEEEHHISEQQSPALRARQEYTYPALFVMLPVVITMATVPFSDNYEVKNPACPSRVGLCPIQGNSIVFTSMAYTWSLLLSLSVLALAENSRGQKSWKIPWLILVGFLSYTVLVSLSYFKLPCSHDSWFNFVVYLLVLINPATCLFTVYLPKLHLISTCSLHLKSFQKSSGSMRKGSRYQDSSTGEVIVNHALHAGSHEVTRAGLLAGLHASTRPASCVSDTSSRVFNIQKSIQIVSNLFGAKEPGYQLLRQPSHYDNVREPVITLDNISQSSLAITLASDVDDQSIGCQSEGSLELAEITFEELKEMTEFLKGLRSSDV